jgi:transketolase
VGVATGLAEAGFIPFLYSIATFATMRPYEFIRNGPILQQFPVRIVGVGGGLEYGHAGLTHYALEDVGIMRTQPGITLIAPADYQQARTALLKTWNLQGPIYYRLGKNENDVVSGLQGGFELGQVQIIREGSDILLISMGSISRQVIGAAEILATRGIESTAVVVACIRPAPSSQLLGLLQKFSLALTIEEHYVDGGVGSLVCELVAERGLSCRVLRFGVASFLNGVTGSEPYMQHAYGLTSQALAEKVGDVISQSRK